MRKTYIIDYSILKCFLCSSPPRVMSWPLCSHNLNLKDDPSVFSPHNSLPVNPPMAEPRRLFHQGRRPLGAPGPPCPVPPLLPPGTQQTGAVLHRPPRAEISFPAELTWAANINQRGLKARLYYRRKTCQSHGTVVSVPAANTRTEQPCTRGDSVLCPRHRLVQPRRVAVRFCQE